MTSTPPEMLDPHLRRERPPFERIALLLQGGGALGSYQAGVYDALYEANIHPDWVAGISIGALNAAVIAGNPPALRVARLREFWEAITSSPLVPLIRGMEIKGDYLHSLVNQFRAFNVLLAGAPNFFKPRLPPPYFQAPGTTEALSYYDTSPLQATLERFVDFDRINSGETRLSVGATNVRTGNFAYFDTTTHRIGPEHIMASGALPPGFPPVEIEGEFYWDGGVVSNTPLQWVLDSRPRADTLAFQVDLWNARGEIPRDLNRGRPAHERDPLFEPHAARHRRVPENAAAAARGRSPPEATAGRPPQRSRMETAGIRGGRESLQRRPSHLSSHRL